MEIEAGGLTSSRSFWKAGHSVELKKKHFCKDNFVNYIFKDITWNVLEKRLF